MCTLYIQVYCNGVVLLQRLHLEVVMYHCSMSASGTLCLNGGSYEVVGVQLGGGRRTARRW